MAIIYYLTKRKIRLIGALVLIFDWLLPQAIHAEYLMYLLTIMNTYAVLAISWDFLFGYLGLLSLGHSFFMGVAGYSAALMALNYGIPPIAAIFLGPLVAIVITLAVGLPSLRLRGHFFALLTFLLILVAAKITDATPWLGGHDGLFGIPFLSSDMVIKRLLEFNMSFVLLVFALAVTLAIVKSRYGLMLQAIREDEVAARAAGIDVTKYKMYGLIVSAYVAGLSGSFIVFLSGVVNPTIYGLDNASYPLIMSFLIGRGTIFGPVIGAYLIKGIEESLRIEILLKARLFIYATIVFLIFYFYRGGLIDVARQISESMKKRGGSRP